MPENVLHERRTAYTRLRVVDLAGWRYLVFDDDSGDPRLLKTQAVYQSRLCLADPQNSWDAYSLAFQIPFLLGTIRRVFFVGLGGGTIIRQYLERPQLVQLDVAELDAEVVEVAREYFFLPDDARLCLKVGDGRQELEAAAGGYDLIALDAFGACAMPGHLLTLEFFRLVRTRLGPSGVVALNVNAALTGPGSRWFHRIGSTLQQSWPHAAAFPTLPGWPRRCQMILMVASTQPLPPVGRLQHRISEAKAQYPLPERLAELVAAYQVAGSRALAPLSDQEVLGQGALPIY